MKNTTTNILTQLERIIEEGEQAALAAGRALKRIQDERLYEPEYSSFMSYLATRWKFSRQRAAQLIQMAETVTTHATRVDISKWPEGHVRPLGKLTVDRQALAIQQFSALPEKQQTGKAMARVVRDIIRTPVNGVNIHAPFQQKPDGTGMTTPIGWYGGKARLAETVIGLMPEHNTYIEPFFGGGSILFAKKPSKIEVVSDVNRGVVNFFNVLRDPEKAKQLQHLLKLTPYARDEHQQCLDPAPTANAVEDARKFFVRVRQSYSSIEGDSWALAVREHGQSRATDTANTVDRLLVVAERLRRVQVESKSFTVLLPRCDVSGALIYCDPPYPDETRTASSNGYLHEMSDEDHSKLLNILCGLRNARILLSGYDCPLYDKRLKGWARHEVAVTVHASGARGSAKAKRTECIWRNY